VARVVDYVWKFVGVFAFQACVMVAMPEHFSIFAWQWWVVTVGALFWRLWG